MLTAHITTLSSTKKYTRAIELIQTDPVKNSLQKNYSCIKSIVHWPSTRPWHICHVSLFRLSTFSWN